MIVPNRLLAIAFGLSCTVLGTVEVPPPPDLRYLSRVLVVRVMVESQMHRPFHVNVAPPTEAAIADTLQAGGIFVPRRSNEAQMPPEAGRVPWQTLLFRVQTAVYPESPGVVSLAYQAALVEYITYPPNTRPPGPSLPLVLLHEEGTLLLPLATDAQLLERIKGVAGAASSRIAKAILTGRRQAQARR